MSLKFSLIEIFTNEEARYQNKPLYDAIVQYIRGLKIAARCMVMKGIEACYENGEIATQHILDLSFNMPLKMEILLPSAELDRILPTIEEMVGEGILAVRELQIRCHKIRKYFIPKHTTVKEVMTPSPKTVAVSAPVDEVVRLLLSSRFTGVPVVDSENRPVGIISQGDLIYRAKMPMRLGLWTKSDQDKVDTVLESLSHKEAGEIMTQPVVSIKADELLTNAVNLMVTKDLKRLPVVDASGKLVGNLSRIDVFRAITRESPDWEAIRKQKIILSDLRSISDIMRRDTFSVFPDTSIEDVIHFIETSDIQCVAVVNTNREFMGLIFDRDLLTVFSEHRVSIWEYLAGKISFRERGPRHRAFVKKLREKTAAELIKKDLPTVLEETSIDEAIELMTEKALKHLPVLDTHGKFKGLISRESLLRAAFKNS